MKAEPVADQPAPKPGTVAYLASIAGAPGQALKGFVDAVYADARLDAKTRELVFLGVQTALNFEDAVRAHVPRAVAAGATRDEIVAAMMVAVVNGGLNGALRLVPLVDELLQRR
jgi:alkylhydroperoxidase/carboxymuconolactone decarboxylase family protein YurZ